MLCFSEKSLTKMNPDSEEEFAYKVHFAHISESDYSSSDGKSDYDEEFEKMRPPPLPVDDSTEIIKIEPFIPVCYKKNIHSKIYPSLTKLKKTKQRNKSQSLQKEKNSKSEIVKRAKAIENNLVSREEPIEIKRVQRSVTFADILNSSLTKIVGNSKQKQHKLESNIPTLNLPHIDEYCNDIKVQHDSTKLIVKSETINHNLEESWNRIYNILNTRPEVSSDKFTTTDTNNKQLDVPSSSTMNLQKKDSFPNTNIEKILKEGSTCDIRFFGNDLISSNSAILTDKDESNETVSTPNRTKKKISCKKTKNKFLNLTTTLLINKEISEAAQLDNKLIQTTNELGDETKTSKRKGKHHQTQSKNNIASKVKEENISQETPLNYSLPSPITNNKTNMKYTPKTPALSDFFLKQSHNVQIQNGNRSISYFDPFSFQKNKLDTCNKTKLNSQSYEPWFSEYNIKPGMFFQENNKTFSISEPNISYIYPTAEGLNGKETPAKASYNLVRHHRCRKLDVSFITKLKDEDDIRSTISEPIGCGLFSKKKRNRKKTINNQKGCTISYPDLMMFILELFSRHYKQYNGDTSKNLTNTKVPKLRKEDFTRNVPTTSKMNFDSCFKSNEIDSIDLRKDINPSTSKRTQKLNPKSPKPNGLSAVILPQVLPKEQSKSCKKVKRKNKTDLKTEQSNSIHESNPLVLIKKTDVSKEAVTTADKKQTDLCETPSQTEKKNYFKEEQSNSISPKANVSDHFDVKYI